MSYQRRERYDKMHLRVSTKVFEAQTKSSTKAYCMRVNIFGFSLKPYLKSTRRTLQILSIGLRKLKTRQIHYYQINDKHCKNVFHSLQPQIPLTMYDYFRTCSGTSSSCRIVVTFSSHTHTIKLLLFCIWSHFL